ncbi:MAG: ribose-phosphate pyrophosphokinase [Candidatus Firestonebacteria bacterium]|nr:ribose-phosphate pyrophosphokinase [Candidatus Firestonebacteria bacterium]
MPELKIFTPTAHPSLAHEICDYLKIPLGNSETTQFSDGEILVKITDNVRGGDVFVIQPVCGDINKSLMEILIMVDALKRSSANKITAVIPYYAYARQDRKTEPRVPITAKLVANLLTISGIERLVAMDLHAGQIQGFFDIPVDHLFSAPVIVDYFTRKNIPDLVVVSPDAGGAERARAVAKRLKASLAMIDKRRTGPNIAEVMNVIGDIKDKSVLILDDIIDTAGTLTKAAKALEERGAKEIFAVGTHALLSGPAIERIENSAIKEVVVTNTIPLPKEKMIPKIKVLSVAVLLGEAIRRIHENTSVSSLFI